MLNVGLNQTVMVFEGDYGTVQQPGKPRDIMIAARLARLLHRTVIALKNHHSLVETDIEHQMCIRDRDVSQL